jgi:hypothetical protein
MQKPGCEHLANLNINDLKLAKAYECETCAQTGDRWVHLRTCQTCGVTLCCDSSPNKHASKHARAHGHHVIISAEPGPRERWAWCFEHEEMMRF